MSSATDHTWLDTLEGYIPFVGSLRGKPEYQQRALENKEAQDWTVVASRSLGYGLLTAVVAGTQAELKAKMGSRAFIVYGTYGIAVSATYFAVREALFAGTIQAERKDSPVGSYPLYISGLTGFIAGSIIPIFSGPEHLVRKMAVTPPIAAIAAMSIHFLSNIVKEGLLIEQPGKTKFELPSLPDELKSRRGEADIAQAIKQSSHQPVNAFSHQDAQVDMQERINVLLPQIDYKSNTLDAAMEQVRTDALKPEAREQEEASKFTIFGFELDVETPPWFPIVIMPTSKRARMLAEDEALVKKEEYVIELRKEAARLRPSKLGDSV